MLYSSTLTTAQILEAFTEEVALCGGRITDTFHDGQRLLTRSVLPRIEAVRRGDKVQGGVALKATGDGVWVYPYIFRQVCANGATIAEALEARSLGGLHEQDPEAAILFIREGVADCCAPEVFLESVRKMRTNCDSQANLALTLMPLLSRLSASGSPEVLSQILDRFFRDGDKSQFGLANAVTAVARDTQDPDLRWNLEEFGGAVLVEPVPGGPANGRHGAIRSGGRSLLGSSQAQHQAESAFQVVSSASR